MATIVETISQAKPTSSPLCWIRNQPKRPSIKCSLDIPTFQKSGSPMLTSFMPSSCMASRAMVMFSRAWGWDWGRLLCRSFRFCNVSTRATNLKHRRDVMRNRIVKLRCDEKVHKTVMESITWVVNKPYTGTQPLL